MRKERARIIIGAVIAFASVAGVFSFFVLWSGPHPLCQRSLDGAFQTWMLETGHTNTYPNANGIGSNSLALVEQFFGKDIQQYGYVPGLHCDDPTNLVLMYLKRQTRYTWHSDTTHTIFSPPRWMVVSPDILTGACPEGGELLETPEFKRQLRNTIAFLKERQRPYWQTVAEEQSHFLKSLRD